MNYFHDSTVILGYIFRGADRWGQQATGKINDPIPNHSSKYVWEECFGAQYDDGSFDNGRCGTIKNQIASEARKVIRKIQLNVPLPEILTQIRNDDFKTTGLFQRFFNQYGSEPQLAEKLKTIFQRFEGICYQRYLELNKEDKIIKFVRRKSYSDIFNHLARFIPDVADIEIVIDGHHLATQISDVHLVTGDEGHIYLNKAHILEGTDITDVIWLGTP
jgi:hypothetical protein